MLSVRSVADLNRAIVAGLHRLDRHSFDAVVGIPRSGMIAASLIATHLQLPLADLTGFKAGGIYGRSGRIVSSQVRRVLLVDDSCNKGRAMAAAAGQLAGLKVTRLAVFGPYREECRGAVDLWFQDCPGPRAFQWNLAKHIRLSRWALDFDGVLCRDPTREENDDGPRYAAFLADAEPVFLPSRPVGHIVTGRLERYRAQTEAWLARHRVEHGGLTMMPFATKAERMAAGGRGQWKAGIARELGVELFIESNPKQAAIIAREAGIPVWCTTTQALA